MTRVFHALILVLCLASRAHAAGLADRARPALTDIRPTGVQHIFIYAGAPVGSAGCGTTNKPVAINFPQQSGMLQAQSF